MTNEAVERVKAFAAAVHDRPWETLAKAGIGSHGPGGKQLLAADLRAILADNEMLRGYVEALLAHTDGLHLPATAQIVRSNARSALTGEGE